MTTTRGGAAQARLDAIGISRMEFADRAKMDRGTLSRALEGDPSVSPRTWGKLEAALVKIEDELGMAESGHTVTSTIEYRGARITMAGTPADVAEAIRRVLADDRPVGGAL